MKRFLKNRRGATQIEYVMIAALIGIAALASMSLLGNKTSKTFNNVTTKVNKAIK